MAFYSGEYEDMSEVLGVVRKMTGIQFIELFKKELREKGFHVQTYDKIARIQNIVRVNTKEGRGFLVYYQASEHQLWWNFSHNGINEMFHNDEGLMPLVVCGIKKGSKFVYYQYKILKEGSKRFICNLDKGVPICNPKDCLEPIAVDEDKTEYCFENVVAMFGAALRKE